MLSADQASQQASTNGTSNAATRTDAGTVVTTMSIPATAEERGRGVSNAATDEAVKEELAVGHERIGPRRETPDHGHERVEDRGPQAEHGRHEHFGPS